MLEQRDDLEAHIREAQEEALRQLEDSQHLLHEEVDSVQQEATEALEGSAGTSLAEVAQAASSRAGSTTLDAQAEARLLERALGQRAGQPGVSSTSISDVFDEAALKRAEHQKQDGEGGRGFWAPQQFGRDADGNPVAGRQTSFDASREARKAVASPAAAGLQRKSPAVSRDVKATREKARTAAQTAATRMPASAMSAEQRSQLASAVIQMNMQSQAMPTGVESMSKNAEKVDRQQAADVRLADPAGAVAAHGGLIGYMASYPMRNAQTKRSKAHKQQAKMQRAKAKSSQLSGSRTLQQKGGGIQTQLGTPPSILGPLRSGGTRHQNPMLSMTPLSQPGDEDDDMGID